jgi:hypothetical protein
MASVWSKPGEWPPSLIHGVKPPYRCTEARFSLGLRHVSGIDRNDVVGRKIIPKCDLEWGALLSHNHPRQGVQG